MKHQLSLVGRCCGFLLIVAVALSLYGCNDTSSVTAPPPGPGPLAILTPSPLPDGAINVNYSVALSATGGTPGYTWSLAAGSPQLPAGLTLTPNGVLSGKPTTAGGPVDLLVKVQDSATTPASIQKTLSITIDVTPAPLQITSTSPLPSGTINTPYFVALTGNGGTTPYSWGLKAGSPPLPPGLTLDTANGFIQGTPTQTSNTTPIFTLRDAASTTVEKALTLTISAVPLSITTTSPLPQGTANQNYNTTLAATGGTGSYTWGLAGGSPPLPNGLTLNASTGSISGIPTTASSLTHTFTVTDQTTPTPQTVSKALQLVIGTAPPVLSITTSSPLPSGTVTQPYSFTLAASGGTGGLTWDLSSGSLPVGLGLSSSGVISGTPVTTGTSTPTFRVRDSGNPQQTATKLLSITINNPAPPDITTTSLPAGTFNVAYNQTLQLSGGTAPFVWSFNGQLPPGVGLNTSTGVISGTPSSTGTFNFTPQVIDSTFQTDSTPPALSITINPPAPPSITSPNSASLPTGTVNQPYPNTQLTATGGAQPYTWSVSPALPNGLSLDPNSGIISGTPLSGSNGNYNPTFMVTDSTLPTHQTGTRSYTLTINANVTPVTITTTSLPNGTVNQAYSAQLAASGGTQPYNWGLNPGSSLPPGLTLTASGAITGTPTTQGTTQTTFLVQDSTSPNQQSATKQLSITINAASQPLTITTNSPLPSGKVGDAYGTVTPATPVTLTASGGTPPYTWSTIVTPDLPTGLSINSAGTISGTPTVSETNVSHTFTVTDSASTPGNANKALSLTIAP